jgi:hypothetical protein
VVQIKALPREVAQEDVGQRRRRGACRAVPRREYFATYEPTALNALGEYVLFGGDAYAVARQMLSALKGSGTDSVRGRKVRNLMADLEKVTNILLDAERWNLR